MYSLMFVRDSLTRQATGFANYTYSFSCSYCAIRTAHVAGPIIILYTCVYLSGMTGVYNRNVNNVKHVDNV